MHKYPRFTSLVLHLLIIGAWALLVLFSPNVWWHAFASLPFLLLMPGYLSGRLLIGNSERIPRTRRLPYYVGLSLLVLMLSGLILNEAYVLFGLSRPLSLVPLTTTVSLVCAGLAAVASWRGRLSLHMPRFSVSRAFFKISTPAILISAALPVLAVAGALTLNNGGTAGLALLTFGSIAGVFLMLVWRRRDLSPFYPLFLFSAGLSLLIGTSLRGWNITGHDVMQEYQVFMLTLSHAAWHMRYYQDAYMACLSITILPTVFQRLTSIPDPYIFKFVFQLFFALIGPVLYEAIRPYTSKRVALIATFLFISFPTFLTDIMMLNRQETALLFLALALMASADKILTRTSRSLLMLSFLAGMVFSHYSTSYEALGTFVWAIIIAFLWQVVQRFRSPSKRLKSDRKPNLLFSERVIFAAVVLLIGWGSVATQTTNNIAQTFQALSQSLSAEVKKGGESTPKPSLPQFSVASRQGEGYPAAAFYPAKTVAAYPLEAAKPTTSPPTASAKRLGLSENLLSAFYNLIRNGYELLIALAMPAGILFLLWFRRRYRIPLQYIFLGAGAFIMIVIELAFPSAINYGLARAIQQALLFAALPIVLLLRWLIMCLRFSKQAAEKLSALILVAFFLVLSGFLPALSGGAGPVLPLSNSGLYYSAYYTHQEEIAAGQWLDNDAPPGSQVNSDEFARRKLIAYANIFSQPTLAPSAIPVDSYAFLSYGDNVYDQVPVYDGSALLYYKPPIKFLQANKNEVYSSNNVTIYK